jgi:hypothetical protein
MCTHLLRGGALLLIVGDYTPRLCDSNGSSTIAIAALVVEILPNVGVVALKIHLNNIADS